MGHFQQNQDTGERYLRLAMREWYQKKGDDEETANNDGELKSKKTMTQSKLLSKFGHELHHQFNSAVSRAEVHSMVFFKLVDEHEPGQSPLEYQGSVLYDISSDYLDILSGGFDNDFFICKNHETFFFRREKAVGPGG